MPGPVALEDCWARSPASAGKLAAANRAAAKSTEMKIRRMGIDYR